MWARDLSGIWFTGERENISGVFELAVNDWAVHTHSGILNRSASLTFSGTKR